VASFPWLTKWECNAAMPIVDGNRIFISSGYGRGCALLELSAEGDAAKLTQVYTHRKLKNHCNNSVLYRGHLYGFDGQQGSGGPLVCMAFDSGKIQWSQSGMKIGSLLIADGKIVALLDGGLLVIAEAAPGSYREIARAQVLSGKCWTSPVLAHGRIYCRNHEPGELVCVDVRE
jgi:hypothetical protein